MFNFDRKCIFKEAQPDCWNPAHTTCHKTQVINWRFKLLCNNSKETWNLNIYTTKNVFHRIMTLVLNNYLIPQSNLKNTIVLFIS